MLLKPIHPKGKLWWFVVIYWIDPKYGWTSCRANPKGIGIGTKEAAMAQLEEICVMIANGKLYEGRKLCGVTLDNIEYLGD